MANADHFEILKQGVDRWNKWRDGNPDVNPDLSRIELPADLLLAGAYLNLVDFRDAKLNGAILYGAKLYQADLSGADLTGATLDYTFLAQAKMVHTKLVGAQLLTATLIDTDLSEADLSNANLQYAQLVGTRLRNARLRKCHVYGTSVWGVETSGADQTDLLITRRDEPTITVDNLEIAQFIYLLLNNQKIRHVIDSITSKVVLILGRFTPERKVVLDAIRDELRKRDYLPVLFDFDKPSNRDITETVSTLAHMARFVIADLSDPKSIPHELAHVAPLLPSVPIMPLIVRPQKEYAMFEHFFGFRHVLKPQRYRDETHLLSILNDKVIAPAEKLAQRVAGKRSRR